MGTPSPTSTPPIPQTLTQRLAAEGLVTIRAAAAELGIPISGKTALRWAIQGLRGVRLESVRIVGRRMTSRAALARFLDRQQQDAPPAMRAIDVAAAEQVLAAHGLPRRSGVAR
jgi:hypothetical protein